MVKKLIFNQKFSAKVQNVFEIKKIVHIFFCIVKKNVYLCKNFLITIIILKNNNLQMKYFYLLTTICIFVSCLQKQENPFENVKFQQGDLIFRKGTGIKSQAVLHADSLGAYSHTGIIVFQDSMFQVVHITPDERENGETVDKIKIEPISDFWRKDRAKHGAVYRLKDNGLGEKAAQQALRLLQKGILFDHNYLLNDTTEMYCTEFVWYSYQKAGKDISNGKRSTLGGFYAGTYIFPSDIYSNDEFVLIYKF